MYYTNVSLSKELKGGWSSHTASLRPDDNFQGPHQSLEANMLAVGLFAEIGAVQWQTTPRMAKNHSNLEASQS